VRLFLLILRQTLAHAFRKGGGAFGTLAFYIIMVTLFIFALGPDGMKAHAGAVTCVGLLLAVVTSLPLIYERDFEDGTLEQFLLQPVLLEIIVLARIAGQFLAVTAPIIIASPLIALMAGLDSGQITQIVLLLLLASPTLVAIGSVAAALTLGMRRGGLLQALVVLPFYIPVLIFAATGGQGAVLFLSGMLLASLPLSCFIGAWLIKAATE
jgi:heme exporter protein B